MKRVKRNSRKRTRRESGAALAEYGLLVAGITMASLVAVSVLGGKVGGLVASVATLLPGATPEDNDIVQVGELVETVTTTDGGVIKLDDQAMLHQRSQRTTSQLSRALGLESAKEAAHLYQLGDREISQ